AGHPRRWRNRSAKGRCRLPLREGAIGRLEYGAHGIQHWGAVRQIAAAVGVGLRYNGLGGKPRELIASGVLRAAINVVARGVRQAPPLEMHRAILSNSSDAVRCCYPRLKADLVELRGGELAVLVRCQGDPPFCLLLQQWHRHRSEAGLEPERPIARI